MGLVRRRKRFFGVQFPIGIASTPTASRFHSPLGAADAQLPINPSTDVPAGFTDAQRGQPNGFAGGSE